MASASTQPLRLVLDTNVVVAGLLWNGPPRRLLDFVVESGAVKLFSSAVLLDELAHTLGYPKFSARIDSFGTSTAALVMQYVALVGLVAPASVPRVVPDDADDDHVIAAAVAAQEKTRCVMLSDRSERRKYFAHTRDPQIGEKISDRRHACAGPSAGRSPSPFT